MGLHVWQHSFLIPWPLPVKRVMGSLVHYSSHPSFIQLNFYSKIIVGSHTIVRNNTERCHIPCPQSPPMVTSYKTLASRLSQETDTDKRPDTDSSITRRIPHERHPHPITDPISDPMVNAAPRFSISIILSFQECDTNEIIQCIGLGFFTHHNSLEIYLELLSV